MEKDSYDILKLPLLVLKILGRHPRMNPVLDKISAAFYLVTLTYLFIITFLQYQNMNNDVYVFANNFEGSAAYIQIGGKVLFTIISKDKFIALLEETELFWNVNKCSGSEKKKLKNVLKYTGLILKIFVVCVAATEVLIVIAPIFTKDLAVGAWTRKNQHFLFLLTLTIQECFLLFIFTTFTFIIDCIFLVLFIYTIVQFKILNHCIRQLKVYADRKDEKKYAELLKTYIKHHIFLLNYSKKLTKTASPVMLIEYMTTAVLFCTEMYMFIESNNIQESIRRPVSFCAVLFQLSFYCLPADYVTSETAAVSDALFDTNWINIENSDTRKTILFVLQRTQQPVTFSAGGLFKINSETLINVVKMSWSVCTILVGLKNKQL